MRSLRPTRRNAHAAVVVVAALGLGSVTPARADDRGGSTLQAELSGQALDDYRIARALFEGSDFVAAFAKFESAYARSKNVRLLWNMAACKKSSHQYAATEALLKRYLADGDTKLSSESVAKAEALLGTLSQLLGTVTIRGADDAARISLDDRELTTEERRAPFRLEIGEHVLSASKPGHRELSQRFALAPGQAAELGIRLTPLSARLSVVTDDDAQVWLDGQSIGVGRATKDVSPGTHSIKLSASNRKTYTTSVNLEPGATRTVQITLERGQAPLWPWVAGGVVVAAGLTTVAYFVFRRADVVTSPSGSLPPNAIQLP